MGIDMNVTRKIIALITLCALSACSSSMREAPSDQPLHGARQPSSAHVGFVVYGHSDASLYLAQALERGDTLTVQYPSSTGDALCCRDLSVDGADKRESEAVTALDAKTGASLHRFDLVSGMSDVPFIGIATVNATKVTQDATGDSVTVHAPSGPMRVISCLSQEGSHLFVRQDGRIVSHLYYGFDYEVEPTCPDELFEVESRNE
jgi:hypothetical protein